MELHIYSMLGSLYCRSILALWHIRVRDRMHIAVISSKLLKLVALSTASRQANFKLEQKRETTYNKYVNFSGNEKKISEEELELNQQLMGTLLSAEILLRVDFHGLHGGKSSAH